jgi:cysteine desulfurase/selenocysteine lyase
LAFDPQLLRNDFPMLGRKMNDHPFIYLDNAATTQKPKAVIDAITKFYSEEYATVHRAFYEYAVISTEKYSESRRSIQRFINAKHEEEIIFTRGTTESLNIIALTYAREFLNAGDEILITEMEHHSNIVPWQMVAEERGASLVVAPINDDGELILEEFEKRLSVKTKIVSLCHISNLLGTLNPVREVIKMAHKKGAICVVDGAQSIAHEKIDVQEMDADFFAFSGHKVYGPTGIGVLYGKKEILEKMRPYHGGGDMVKDVTFAKTTYQEAPLKFEAGTPSIADVIGLGAAIDYVASLDRDLMHKHEMLLLEKALKNFSYISGVEIYGNATNRSSLVTFNLDGVHSMDLGVLLGLKGIAIRTGAMCASPVLKRLKAHTAARISFSFYNTIEEIEIFFQMLEEIRAFL